MQDLLDDEKKRLKRLSPKTIGKAKNQKGNKIVEAVKKDKQQLKLIPQAKEENMQENIIPAAVVEVGIQAQSTKKE